MYRLLILLVIPLTNAGKPCDGIIANFDLKSVSGKWHMVAVVPNNLFPDVECFSAGTVEADEAKLRELNNTSDNSSKISPGSIKGSIIRQRYYTERIFDLWAKGMRNDGCFQKDLVVDVSHPKYILVNDVFSDKILTEDDTMIQLHMIDAADGSEPFLVHILSGKPVSATIYRKTQAVTQEQLKPVYEFMKKMRGPQRLPKLCQNDFQSTQGSN